MSTLTNEEIRRLTPQERLELIEQLWDSLQPDDIPFTGAQRNELDRRLEGFDDDRAHGVSWHELKARLANRNR